MAHSIMVINSSKSVLTLFKEILVDEGHTTHLRLFNGSDVQSDILAVKPDLVIIDCSDGKHSEGWELLQQLRQKSVTRYLPVVMCSTEYLLFEEKRDYLISERIVILPKPFDINDLFKAIDQAFKLNELTSNQGNDPAFAGSGV